MNSTVTNKKENKRQGILDAAFSLFMQNGYAKVKVIDIAQAAGIGKGTIYEYFDSKDAILIELVTNVLKKEFLDFKEEIHTLHTFEEKLTAIVAFEFDFLKRYGPHAPEIKQHIFEIKDLDYSEALVKAIGELVYIECENISEVVQFGIDSGVVRDMPIGTAVRLIIGLMTAFMPLPDFSVETCPFIATVQEEASRVYTPEDVCEMILKGIGA